MVGAGVTRLSHRVSCFVRGERKEMEFHENIGLELSLNDEVAKKKVSQKDEDLQHHSPSPPPSPHKDPDP